MGARTGRLWDISHTNARQIRKHLSFEAIAIAALLATITIVAFWPTLDNGFVNWDDNENFLTNYDFRGLGWNQIVWAWTTFRQGTYQPLGWMLLSAEYAAWGLDPRGYHAVSVLLHAATIVALYALTIALLERCRFVVPRKWSLAACAGLAVAWFAVHPLRVEAVAWISCQPYLPCALFYVLAILAYLRACDADGSRHARWLGVTLLFFTLSLLSKAPAVSLPAVLLILDGYPLRRLGGWPRVSSGSLPPAWREKVWFLGPALAFSVLAYNAKASTFNSLLLARGSLLSRTAAACYALWFYVSKTLVPTNLAAYYLVPGPVTWRTLPFLGSLLGVFGVSTLLFRLRSRWPGLLALWAATLVILIPVSSVVSISTQLVADRYAYLPGMVWVLPFAASLLWLTASTRRFASTLVVSLVSISLIASLTAMTRQLTLTWRDSQSLWTHALSSRSGRTMMAYNNLAMVYFDRGQIDEGIAVCRTALTLPQNPSDLTGRILIRTNLATFLEQQGHFGEAAAQFAELARVGLLSADAQYKWGRVLAAQGKVDEAIAHYQEALRIDPNDAAAKAGLTAALSMRQKLR